MRDVVENDLRILEYLPIREAEHTIALRQEPAASRFLTVKVDAFEQSASKTRREDRGDTKPEAEIIEEGGK